MNEIRVSVWNVLRPVLVTGMVVLSALACDTGSGGSSSKKDPEPTLTVTATVIDKHAASDLRNSYGLFSITANEDVADYYLAVKETGEPAPTAAEMTAHGLKRDLSSTAIPVLIAQRMDAPMITFAKTYFGDPAQKDLGTGMTGHFQTDEQATFFDGDDSNSPYVEATDPWIEGSVLKPETDYMLYGMGDGAVQALLAFTTDASPASWTRQEADRIGVDTTVDADNGLTLTLNSDEYYIIPLQVITQDSLDISALEVIYSQRIGIELQISGPRLNAFGLPARGYEYQLVMFPFQSTFVEAVRNSYVLIDTSRIRKNGSSSLEWEARMTLSDGSFTSNYKLKFNIQE